MSNSTRRAQRIALKRRKRALKVKGMRQHEKELSRAVHKKMEVIMQKIEKTKPKQESAIPVSVASQSLAEEQGINDSTAPTVEI